MKRSTPKLSVGESTCLATVVQQASQKKRKEKEPCKCKSQRAENTLNDCVKGSAGSQEKAYLNSRN